VTGEIEFSRRPSSRGTQLSSAPLSREVMTPRSMRNNKGYVRDFDVRTGKRLDFSHHSRRVNLVTTLGKKTRRNTPATRACGRRYSGRTTRLPICRSNRRRAIFTAAIGRETSFGETLLRGPQTGERKWHFQPVHHPLWDMDISPRRFCATLRRWKTRPKPSHNEQAKDFFTCSIAYGKTGVAIPESPLKWAAFPGNVFTYQPIPFEPSAYSRNGVSVDDLIDFTPALHDRAKESHRNIISDQFITPPTG